MTSITFLGIEVIHYKDGLFLTQSRYALDLLERASITNCKPISALFATSHKIKKFVNSSFLSLLPHTEALSVLQIINYY